METALCTKAFFIGPLDIAAAIFEWLFVHIPMVATVMAFLTFAVWSTYRVAGRVSSIAIRFRKVETSVNVLDEMATRFRKVESSVHVLEGLATRFSKMETNVHVLQDDVRVLKENMVVVNKRLDGIDVKLKQ